MLIIVVVVGLIVITVVVEAQFVVSYMNQTVQVVALWR